MDAFKFSKLVYLFVIVIQICLNGANRSAYGMLRQNEDNASADLESGGLIQSLPITIQPNELGAPPGRQGLGCCMMIGGAGGFICSGGVMVMGCYLPGIGTAAATAMTGIGAGFVSISGVIFVCGFDVFERASRSGVPQQQQQRNLPPLSAERVAQVVQSRQDPCSICLESYDPGQQILVTSCGHIFHEHCAHDWIQTNPCPLCRIPVSEVGLAFIPSQPETSEPSGDPDGPNGDGDPSP